MTSTNTIDIAALASHLDTDARTTRKFMRSITPAEGQPGKGSRWAIDASKANLARLTKAFANFAPAPAAADDDAPATA